jgi:hypothetical protein
MFRCFHEAEAARLWPDAAIRFTRLQKMVRPAMQVNSQRLVGHQHLSQGTLVGRTQVMGVCGQRRIEI